LRGHQRHICTASGRVKFADFTWFPDFEKSLLVSLDLRSKKLNLSICFKTGPNERVKCFQNFHYWKFKHASVDLELFAISTYKKFHFNNCKVDSVMRLIAFHLNLRFLEVHFSMLIQFLVVCVTSNSKKFLDANFSNIVGRCNILK